MFFNQAMLIGGGVAQVVNITDQNFTDTVTPGPAECQYILQSNGEAYRVTTDGGSVLLTGEWRIGGASADYEVRATEDVGSVTSGPIGTWDSLGTTRTWTKEQVGAGSSSVTLTVEIRLAASGLVLDTAEIIMTGDVS